MIIGTAGHIDHGKTTLVKALTGVDTDRLPQEKQRGISIELGYAFLDAPSGRRIGFIDVPGHERLVHTMLAGATGIDHALLLVAADDGPMPQTREHLAVLSLLGVQSATVAVTKCDRVDADRIAQVTAQSVDLLAGTPLEGSPAVQVSAASGQGIDALLTRLFELEASQPGREEDHLAFRMAVDRVFTVEGTGTVVTGTLHAGSIAVGDELALLPGSTSLPLARVRSVHAQNRRVERAHAHERCALAVAGFPKEAIRRGDWLVHPAVALTTDRIDVHVTVWAGESRPLRGGTPVHVHLGAGSTLGTVALLDPVESIAPGERARVQLVLRQPIGAWTGDRVVLRDAAATRTLAGGTVIDPTGPARYRRTAQRLAELSAWDAPTPEARRAALLAVSPLGVDLRHWRRAEALHRTLPPPAMALCATTGGEPSHALANTHRDAAAVRILGALETFHAAHPDELGPDASRLRRLALPRLAEPLWRALLAWMIGDGVLAARGACVHLPAHGLRLSGVDERIAQKIAPRLAEAGFEGAWARDLARATQESEPLMRVTLARLSQRGDVHQVVHDLVYPPATMRSLAGLARQLAAANDGTVTAATFRDATGLGRKRAIQILEYFDRIGVTRRVGDGHRLRPDCALFTEVSDTVSQSGSRA